MQPRGQVSQNAGQFKNRILHLFHAQKAKKERHLHWSLSKKLCGEGEPPSEKRKKFL